MKEETKPIYLGDGVYADFDGRYIYIWTFDGITKSDRIAIDTNTFVVLMEYARKCWAPNE